MRRPVVTTPRSTSLVQPDTHSGRAWQRRFASCPTSPGTSSTRAWGPGACASTSTSAAGASPALTSPR